MSVTVRTIDDAEWVTWRDLRLRSLEDAPDSFGSTLEHEQPFTEADWRQRLDGIAVIGFVDEVPAALGGAFLLGDTVAHIIAMWTAPAFRQRGLAGLVLNELIDRAHAAGRSAVLDVVQTNAGARRLYEARGFVPTGQVAPLREGCDLLVDEMILPL